MLDQIAMAQPLLLPIRFGVFRPDGRVRRIVAQRHVDNMYGSAISHRQCITTAIRRSITATGSSALAEQSDANDVSFPSRSLLPTVLSLIRYQMSDASVIDRLVIPENLLPYSLYSIE